MSRVRTQGTAPELALRRELHRIGLRYRVNIADLPGKPDIVFTRARIAIFVDGCFWHSCPEHAVAPKANADWWNRKFAATRARDSRNVSLLQSAGWRVVRVWEHEDASTAARRIARLWRCRSREFTTETRDKVGRAGISRRMG
jgi:DNA mismatch endonuclease (patch repair protein)